MKSRMRYNLSLIRVAIIKKKKVSIVVEDMKKSELSPAVNENSNQCNHYRIHFKSGSKY